MMRSGSLIGKDQMFISLKMWKSTSNGSTNAASRSRKRAFTQGVLCENFAAGLGKRGRSRFSREPLLKRGTRGMYVRGAFSLPGGSPWDGK